MKVFKKTIRYNSITGLLLLSSLFFACNRNDNTNSWNKGSITIASDIHLQPILRQLKPVFENANKEAEVNFNYLMEDSIIRGFEEGRYTSMLISRSMTQSEKEAAALKQQTKIIEKPFAYDAIAIIVHPDFSDSVVSLNRLNDFLQPNSAVKLVFDAPKSGIAKQVQSITRIPAENFKTAYALKNTEEVFRYIAQHSNSIGFVPYNAVSTASAFKKSYPVKLLRVQHNDTVYELTQQNLSARHYPLMRTLNFVLGRNPEQVANGFAHFLNRDKAGKILLKSGLVPLFLPDRNFVVKDELPTEQ